LREACRHDPILFCNLLLWTYDPRRQGRKVIPFVLYDYQRRGLTELIEAIRLGEDVGIEKSRDMGATWLCLAAIFWYWMFESRCSFLLVSRVEGLVDAPNDPDTLFWKLDHFLQMLPGWFAPKTRRLSLHLENESNKSVIDGASTSSDTGRGGRRTAIMLDELAAVKAGFALLRATRDNSPCRIVNSTPQGAGGAYWSFMQGVGRKLCFHWSLHPSKGIGLYTTRNGKHIALDDRFWTAFGDEEAAVAEMQRLDRIILSRGVSLYDGKPRSPWYAQQCARAAVAAEIAQELDIDYQASRQQFFSPMSIEAYINKHCFPPLMVGLLEHTGDTAEPIRFVPGQPGPTAQARLALWHQFGLNNAPPPGEYVIGADVAAGTGASNSVLAVYDASTRVKVAEYVDPYIRPEAFARFAVAVARWYHDAEIAWEQIGAGRQFGDALLETGYRRVYRRQLEDRAARFIISPLIGYVPTKEGKLRLLGEYRDALEEEKIINRSADAVRETLEYVFTEGGVEHSAELAAVDPSGARLNHGDRVIADALAWQMMLRRGASQQLLARGRQPAQPPVGSFAWRRQQSREKDGWQV